MLFTYKKTSFNFYKKMFVFILLGFPIVTYADYPYPCNNRKVIVGTIHSYKVGWLALEGSFANACEVYIDTKSGGTDFLPAAVNLEYVAAQKMCDVAFTAYLKKLEVTVRYCQQSNDASKVNRLQSIGFLSTIKSK